MPSPTESTCPTSETSASWPKFLICSLRIEEISAARMSISRPLSSHESVELGAERTVDHADTDQGCLERISRQPKTSARRVYRALWGRSPEICADWAPPLAPISHRLRPHVEFARAHARQYRVHSASVVSF